jgi:DNA-binding response OmpR family regulator
VENLWRNHALRICSGKLESVASVLIIEDNAEVVGALSGFLQKHHFLVWSASNGLEGLKLFFAHKPDVILLDVMMPGINGLEVLRQIRATAATPILLLTARSDEREVVEGLSLGADDYITKPFRLLEVLARLQAVLRRVQHTETLSNGELHIELSARRVRLGDMLLELTNAEYDLLLRLVQQPNRVFKRAELVETLGEERETLERTVDTHIKNLRRKLGANHRLETVYGIGYRYAKA